MKHLPFLFFASLFFFMSCSSDNEVADIDPGPEASALYFPPIGGSEWETVSASDLSWNSSAESELYDFLNEKGTDGFIILKDGKIVVEWYFGDFIASDNHSWNSAGKTLTAMTVGIAQTEGFLSIEDSSQIYLGEGWSMLTPKQEANIKIRHHLTMTTGLDYTVDDPFCYDQECLLYKNEPGTYWYYHNAAYTILDQIITNATATDFKQYSYQKIRDKIGMQGNWIKVGYNNLFFSNTRSMARFGLLCLNQGTWDTVEVLADKSYFTEMTNTSQNLNSSYGYLWWLNGKSGFKAPGSEANFQGELIPNAPSELIAGLGAFDQKLYLVPSENLVVVRLGDDAGESQLASSSFDNQLWEKLNAYFNN
ncbi:serine hydrolase domain-containing protein [Flagellimonas zhangzhouensis]|uniref:CubicO group peptidase, beta-lactamase class C family n=1 Tax=Flagellimonas zhangzhouensis TaxID=1073328 RepID=A0A1H2Z8U6_9FLAO|nr:serine hydrolase domain-containing protein [Allomuricauda zhangzhouensis]SDR07973.1 CubicO group peptidase, beta-lactamase class C family [Allomuricauda zhangzhouensis]SDX13756.1 CubicO group peptidase, beta-lactamase class C family [Allomuricauda zhangzhouensis]